MPELNSGERRPEGRGLGRLWRGDHGVETTVLHGGQNFRQELPNRERAVHAKDDYPVFHVCSAGRSFLFAENDGKGFRRLVPGETPEQQDPETPQGMDWEAEAEVVALEIDPALDRVQAFAQR